MRIDFCTNIDSDHLIPGRRGLGFATRDKVGARPADGVFEDIGYESRDQDGNDKAEDGDVGFVDAGLENEGPDNEESQGKEASEDEEPDCIGTVVSESGEHEGDELESYQCLPSRPRHEDAVVADHRDGTGSEMARLGS